MASAAAGSQLRDDEHRLHGEELVRLYMERAAPPRPAAIEQLTFREAYSPAFASEAVRYPRRG
jgi:hypothetical protein